MACCALGRPAMPLPSLHGPCRSLHSLGLLKRQSASIQQATMSARRPIDCRSLNQAMVANATMRGTEMLSSILAQRCRGLLFLRASKITAISCYLSRPVVAHSL